MLIMVVKMKVKMKVMMMVGLMIMEVHMVEMDDGKVERLIKSCFGVLLLD